MGIEQFLFPAGGALMGGLGSKGGDVDVNFEQSPQQRQMWETGFPLIQMLGATGTGQTSLRVPNPDYVPAQAAQPLDMSGLPESIRNTVPTYARMHGMSEYDALKSLYPFYATRVTEPTAGTPAQGEQFIDQPIPENLGAPRFGDRLKGIDPVGPTQQWWESLSPDVKAGVWQPFHEGADALTERLGATGQLGNARGGISGAAGGALGDYYRKASPQVAQQMWGMSAPGLMADYQNRVGGRLADYQTELDAWRMPFQIMPGMMTGAYPTGLVSNQGNFFSGAGSGLMTGMLANQAFGGGLGGKGGSGSTIGPSTGPYIPGPWG